MKTRSLLCFALVTSMLLSVFMIGPVSAPSTTIGVEPDSIVDPGLVPGSAFTVEIWIRNVADLASVEFHLGYDTAVLTATLIEYGDIFGATYYPGPSEINDAEGWLLYGVMESWGEPGFNGDGCAAIITFSVDSVGESVLDLYDTLLVDSAAYVISHTVIDGYFSNLPAVQYDLTISVVGFGTTSPAPGTYAYNEGAEVDVNAIPDVGYMLDHWELDTVDVGDADPYTVTMDADHTLTAVFSLAPSTKIGVEPEEIINPGLVPGSAFTVEIWIRQVEDLEGFDFKLGYDTNILTANWIEYGGIFGDTYFNMINETYDAEGYLFYGNIQWFGEPSFNGSGRAVIIHFTVDSVGESVLDLYDTLLGGIDGEGPYPIVHEAIDGYFRNCLISTTLAKRRAWPEHQRYVITKDEDTSNDLNAIVFNGEFVPDTGWVPGEMPIVVKVIFTVTFMGMPIGDFETTTMLLAPGEFRTCSTAFVPPMTGKFYVSAQAWADTNGDTVPDTPMGKVKAFSFKVEL